ncbi:MAG TPA: hypothetical protein P5081_16085 [Phycisphaerae bacterium]|nr:hypothetical protein [Phycisphaerae bacterium]HRW54390.1 hypothetical protein [Phycisphaerae bacterium]
MRKWLHRGFVTFCLLVSVAACVAWARVSEPQVLTAPIQCFDHDVSLLLAERRASVVVSSVYKAPAMPEDIHHRTEFAGVAIDHTRGQHLCGMFQSVDANGELFTLEFYTIDAPFWLIATIAMLCPAATLFRRRRRPPPGRCPECRYDLTGNRSGVCPECGRPSLRSDA